jgi:hypothetical protein
MRGCGRWDRIEFGVEEHLGWLFLNRFALRQKTHPIGWPKLDTMDEFDLVLGLCGFELPSTIRNELQSQLAAAQAVDLPLMVDSIEDGEPPLVDSEVIKATAAFTEEVDAFDEWLLYSVVRHLARILGCEPDEWSGRAARSSSRATLLRLALDAVAWRYGRERLDAVLQTIIWCD